MYMCIIYTGCGIMMFAVRGSLERRKDGKRRKDGRRRRRRDKTGQDGEDGTRRKDGKTERRKDGKTEGVCSTCVITVVDLVWRM